MSGPTDIQPESHQPRMVRAAQYVRMSTDMQKYSIDNQEAVIALYAAKRGFLIVKTYADEGKSGLNVKGRKGLRQLIDDIQSGKADFEVLLAYDVSRWGRFQDADESAYYEFMCREAGVAVQYCAEEFENDGSLTATIFKNIKRAMAAEYSRELSKRIFTAKCNMTRRGFRHGSRAGFGLRRMVIDDCGTHKGTLENGQQKFLHSDRTILVPGPPEEVAIVRWAYEKFANGDLSITAIARELNERGIKNNTGVPWTRCAMRDLLSNEKYVGNNIFNKTSIRLKSKRVHNHPADWVRADGAFEPLVSRMLFKQAQARIATFKFRSRKFELLDHLTALWCKHGVLSARIVDRSPASPTYSTYARHFGSLLEAFKELGYPRLTRRPLYVSVRKAISNSVLDHVKAAAGTASQEGYRRQTRLFVNGQLTVTIALAHSTYQTRDTRPRWILKHSAHHHSDLVVIARFNEPSGRVKDFFLLPGMTIDNPQQVFLDLNHISIESFRCDSLTELESLFARQRIDLLANAATSGPKHVRRKLIPIKRGRNRWPRAGTRTSTIVKLFRSLEVQSERMRAFIERAHVITARQKRLDQILKLVFCDPILRHVLSEERIELLPVILAQRISK